MIGVNIKNNINGIISQMLVFFCFFILILEWVWNGY